MKLARILLMITFLLSITAASPVPLKVAEPGVDAGFSVAAIGSKSWYASDWRPLTTTPMPTKSGLVVTPIESLTISEEGGQSIESASQDLGNVNRGSHALQFTSIDQTPPSVRWNSPFNTEVTATFSGLSAEIADPGSGVCLIELSIDHGRNWIEGWNAQGFALNQPVLETTWTYHFGFPEFANGTNFVTLRACDCAGNYSKEKILVVRKR